MALEVAKVLSLCAPFDLEESELPAYKGLIDKWHYWETTRGTCRRYGVLLGEALMQDAPDNP